MSLLGRFQDWSERRLRKSQIRILFQNQCAVEHLIREEKLLVEMKLAKETSTLQDLLSLSEIVSDAILSLTYQTCLEDPASSELLKINNILKANYAALNEGRRLFRAQMGLPRGDLVDFATRFAPAAGWDRLSDTEWDGMVHKAVANLKES